MINTEKLAARLEDYKKAFPTIWKNEIYKWIAIKCFKDNWNLEADDFSEMFQKATDKTTNLLASGYAYPRFMIIEMAKAAPEDVREMFRLLFDESRDLALRVEEFQAKSEEIRQKYNDGTWKNHYQSTNVISTYLWLMYPDKYYIYKYGLYDDAAKELDSDNRPKANGSVESMIVGFRMYDEIHREILKDAELRSMMEQRITPACYPDPNLITLTIDFGHYLGSYYQHERKKHSSDADWIPTDYISPLTADDWKSLLQDPSVFTVGSLEIMKRMLNYGGEATCTQLSVKYGESAIHLTPKDSRNTGTSTSIGTNMII